MGGSDAFSDPEALARHAEKSKRHVPGFEAMLRMAGPLIAERAPTDARVLALDSGDKLDTKAFAASHPGWPFDGVDPSAELLARATRAPGPLAAGATLRDDTIEAAPRSRSTRARAR